MILAAGFGKRMLPLTQRTPKPLLTINAKPLIAYHIENLAKAGITDIVINHAYLGEQIVAYCGDGKQWGVSIRYSAEDEPLETAGGIAKALPLLGDAPFILCNGDIFTDFDFSRLCQQSLHDALAHLVLVKNPEHHPQGDFALTNGRVITADNATQTFTYSGIAIIHPALFQHYQYYHGRLAPLLIKAMQNNQVQGELLTGQWHDVGTPERLAILNRK